MNDLHNVRVRAVPAIARDGSATYLVECSDCGLLGPVDGPESDEMCLRHLEDHGVDVSKYRNAQSTEPEDSELPEVPD